MKDWLYWLLDEDGRSQYVDDATGVPSSTVEKRPLKYSPDPWRDISLGIERNMKLWGFTKKFSIPVNFALDSAKIIRNWIYKNGYGKKLFLLITRRTLDFSSPTVFKDYHTQFSRHEVELVSGTDNEDTYTATLADTGLSRKIELRMDTEFEFPLSDPEAVTVRFSGLNLHSQANYIPIDDIELSDDLFGKMFLAPMSFNSQEGKAAGVAFFSQGLDILNPGISGEVEKYMNESPNYAISVDQQAVNPITFGIVGKIKLNITKNANYSNVRFYLATNKRPRFYAGVPASQNPVLLGSANSASGITGFVEIDVNTSITLAQDEHAFFITEIISSYSSSIGFKFKFAEGGQLNFTYENKGRDTIIRAFTPAVLLDKITERICGEKGRSVSSLFTSTYKGYLLTSGDGLRGIETASVKVSLKTFMDIYHVNCFAGMDVNRGYLNVEDFFAFYQITNPIDLGEASSCKITAPKDIMGNRLVIGHKYKEIDEVNGKLSFNNSQKYIFPFDDVNTEINLVSPAIADPYAIEHVRLGFDGKSTTDSDKDNELFLLVSTPTTTSFRSAGTVEAGYFHFTSQEVQDNLELLTVGGRFTINGTVSNDNIFTIASTRENADGSVDVFVTETTTPEVPVSTMLFSMSLYTLKRYVFSAIEGIPENADVFNTDVTPKSLLLLWRRWINSGLYKLDGKNIKFESADQNAALKLTKNGVTVYESADLPVTSDIIWKPYVFEITCAVPTDIFNVLDEWPSARGFQFTWNNTVFYGFLLVGGVSPANDKPQSYKLLAAPENIDLSPLID